MMTVSVCNLEDMMLSTVLAKGIYTFVQFHEEIVEEQGVALLLPAGRFKDRHEGMEKISSLSQMSSR